MSHKQTRERERLRIIVAQDGDAGDEYVLGSVVIPPGKALGEAHLLVDELWGDFMGTNWDAYSEFIDFLADRGFEKVESETLHYIEG